MLLRSIFRPEPAYSMKVTPLEIRQQTFEKVFRGYDKDAVDAYLTSLSQEWERGQEELHTLRQRNEQLQEEIGRLKAIENTLYRTLQMAEETTSQMTQKAEAEADQRLQSARAEADETLARARAEATESLEGARKQATMLLLDAENRSRFMLEESVEEMRSLERDYKAIERYKEYLVTEIKRFAGDALEKVTRFEEKVQRQTFEAKFGELKAVSLPPETPESDNAPVVNVPMSELDEPEEGASEAPSAVATAPESDEMQEPERPTEDVSDEEAGHPAPDAKGGSFFDTIR